MYGGTVNRANHILLSCVSKLQCAVPALTNAAPHFDPCGWPPNVNVHIERERERERDSQRESERERETEKTTVLVY